MRPRPRPFRRGLTFIELLMALAITAMVTAAISAMWTAISSGERARRDNRAFAVRTYAAKSRISGYIAPCRSLLSTDGCKLVLWRDDSRVSGTVHASEIRWLIFDNATGNLDVYYVKFPSTWTEVAKALRDHEYAVNTNWDSVLNSYTLDNLIGRLTLVDGVASVAVTLDAATALSSREVTYTLGFTTEISGQPVPQTLTAAILTHVTPVNPA